jgi:hypothetical protein
VTTDTCFFRQELAVTINRDKKDLECEKRQKVCDITVLMKVFQGIGNVGLHWLGTRKPCEQQHKVQCVML